MILKRKTKSLFGMTLLIALMALAACDSGIPQVQPTATTGSQVSTSTPTAVTSVPRSTSQPSVSVAPATATTAARATSASTVAASTSLPATGTPTAATSVANTSTPQPTAESTAQAASCTKLDLNVVTEAELLSTIPGFSNRMVREFFEYRPYVSIQQFRREIGKYVDEATVASYEQYVYVPVDANDSDAATLMQLPGVDETVAAALIAGRPYASDTAFLDALSGQLIEDQLAESQCFLAAGE